MRLTFTLILLLLFSSFSYAQKLTGIWRGYFVQQDFDRLTGKFVEEKYKYEVQIDQLKNNSLEGVTYSYKSIVFYGKASLHGLFTASTKNVLLKETKMIDLKISDHSVACLMTCYLDYSKSGKLEMLSGTYTSQNKEDRSDCGSGTIYLEKVKTTDFEKEPFLLKNTAKNPQSITAKKDTVAANKKTVQPSTQKKLAVIPPKQNSVSKNPTVKKGTEQFIVSKKTAVKKDSARSEKIISSFTDTGRKQEKIISKNISPLTRSTSIPRVLRERSNPLVKTIEIDEKEVQIDYYDNGEIDNDTITVYHNNELVVDKGRLSYTPITIKIHLDEADPIHEIITVAENLGDVPPNTALMVITTPGRKRYEVFITSDEKTNAKVILEYKPKKPVKIY